MRKALIQSSIWVIVLMLKGIDYWSLDWSKRVFFTPIKRERYSFDYDSG